MRQIIIALFLILSLVSVRISATVLPDDEAFCTRLRVNNFHQLLSRFCQIRLKDKKLPHDLKKKYLLEYGNACVSLSERTFSASKKKEWLRKAFEAMRKSEKIKTGKGKRESISQKLNFASLYSSQAKIYLQEWQDKNQADRKQIGLGFFNKSLSMMVQIVGKLEKRIEALEEMDVSEKSTVWKEANANMLRTNYQIAWTRLFMSGFFEKGSEQHKKQLQLSKEFFEGFSEEFRDHFVIVSCFMGMGLCEMKLGNTKEASRYFSTIKAKTSNAAFAKQACYLHIILAEEHKDFLGIISSGRKYLYRTDPSQYSQADRIVQLKVANAMFSMAKKKGSSQYKKKAIEMVEKLSKAGEPWKSQALALFKKFKINNKGKAGNQNGQAIFEYWLKANEFLKKRDAAQARENFKKVTAKELRVKDRSIIPISYYQIGVCLFMEKKYKAAMEAFTKFLQRYKENDLCEKAAYNRILCCLKIGATNLTEVELGFFQMFLRKFPNSLKTGRVKELLAGIHAKTGGENKAQKEYQQLAETTGKLSYKALALNQGIQKVVSLAKNGNNSEAEKMLSTLNNDIMGFYKGLGGKATPKELAYAADLEIGLANVCCYPGISDYKKTIKLLQKFEHRYSSLNIKIKARAISLRMGAYSRIKSKEKAFLDFSKLKSLGVPDTNQIWGVGSMVNFSLQNNVKKLRLENLLIYAKKVLVLSHKEKKLQAILWHLANTKYALGKKKESLAILKEIVPAFENNIKVQSLYATNLEDFLKWEAAQQVWARIEKKSDRKSKDWALSRFRSARCLSKLGQNKEALKSIKLAQLLYPGMDIEIKKKMDDLKNKIAVK